MFFPLTYPTLLNIPLLYLTFYFLTPLSNPSLSTPSLSNPSLSILTSPPSLSTFPPYRPPPPPPKKKPPKPNPNQNLKPKAASSRASRVLTHHTSPSANLLSSYTTYLFVPTILRPLPTLCVALKPCAVLRYTALHYTTLYTYL